MTDFSNRILVASPTIHDPMFKNASCLVYQHSSTLGAAGFLLNYAIGDTSYESICKQIENVPREKMFYGGPIMPSIGYVIHSMDYVGQYTTTINDNLGFTGGMTILEDIINGLGPQDYKLMFGYFAWGPNQLEEEMYGTGPFEKPCWYDIASDNSLVFGDTDTMWNNGITQYTEDRTAKLIDRDSK